MEIADVDKRLDRFELKIDEMTKELSALVALQLRQEDLSTRVKYLETQLQKLERETQDWRFFKRVALSVGTILSAIAIAGISKYLGF